MVRVSRTKVLIFSGFNESSFILGVEFSFNPLVLLTTPSRIYSTSALIPLPGRILPFVHDTISTSVMYNILFDGFIIIIFLMLLFKILRKLLNEIFLKTNSSRFVLEIIIITRINVGYSCYNRR